MMRALQPLKVNRSLLSPSVFSKFAKMTLKSASLVHRDPSQVLFERRGLALVIILNRPSALNALNHYMASSIRKKFSLLENDPTIKVVIIKGQGDKAFCCGGDLKELSQTAQLNHKGFQACHFLNDEYSAHYAVKTCKKPVVALADGYTMGSGCSLAVNSQYTVATERTIMSMPETVIGYYPDNGSSYFLTQLGGKLGVYLGLTCDRLIGEESFKCKLATHFVTSKDGSLSELESKIVGLPNPTDQAVRSVLDEYHSKCATGKESTFKSYETKIDAIFGQESMEEIFQRLMEDNSPWSQRTLNELLSKSPTALKISLKMFQEAENLNFFDCLRMELRLGRGILQDPDSDFFRGVKQKILEKKSVVRWNPNKLEDVNMMKVSECFRPMTDFGTPDFSPLIDYARL